MLREPFISIVISSYNYGTYMKKCFKGCEMQTFKDFELIIVDDASTDDSRLVINEFVNRNPQMSIKCIFLDKNMGIQNSRGTGLRAAHGKYVLFHDCDDWMDPNCLEVLAKCAKKTNADKIKAQIRDVNIYGKVIQERKFTPNINRWIDGMMHATLYKRQIFIDYNIEIGTSRDLDDVYLNAHFNSVCKNVEYIYQTVYNYFINANSTSGANKNNSDYRVKIFKKNAEAIAALQNQLDSRNRRNSEYFVIKLYIYSILQYGRNKSSRELIRYYYNLKKVIKHYFPIYAKNKNVTLFKDNGDRFYYRIIVWVCFRLEQLHLLPLALRFYLYISKIIHFHA